MNNEYLDRVLSACRKADRVVVGLSGGADSIALTHILLKNLGADKLICAHVNHMIRGEEAQRDEDFVRSFCSSHNIRLQVLKKDVAAIAKEEKIGTEECGRKIRYGFFEELASGEKDLIATAHNADDNAETILMNIAKGTGLKGLCGIPAVRGKIIRPVLCMSRQEIEDYCNENDLDYVTDSTNLADDYDRNKIRHKVIPVLNEINCNVVDNISRMVSLLTEDNEYLDGEAVKVLNDTKTRWGWNAEKLSSVPLPVLRRAVVILLSDVGGRIEKKHIDAVIEIMHKGGAVCVNSDTTVSVKQNCLTIVKGKEKSLQEKSLVIGENTLTENKNLWLILEETDNCKKINNLLSNSCADYDKIKNTLVVRSRREGDRITLKSRKVTKSLKKLFNEMKIPAHLRLNVAVVADGDNIIFVEGIGVDSAYAVDSGTKNVLKFEITG